MRSTAPSGATCRSVREFAVASRGRTSQTVALFKLGGSSRIVRTRGRLPVAARSASGNLPRCDESAPSPARGTQPGLRVGNGPGTVRRCLDRRSPSGEPWTRAERIDPRFDWLACRCHVLPPVEQDVCLRVAHLRGGRQRTPVMAVREDAAPRTHGHVDPLSEPDVERVEARGERFGRVRLQDQVEVVILEREVGNAEVVPDPVKAAKDSFNRPEYLPIPHVAPCEPDRNQDRMIPSKRRASTVWDLRAPAAGTPRSFAGPSPTREFQLLLDRTPSSHDRRGYRTVLVATTGAGGSISCSCERSESTRDPGRDSSHPQIAARKAPNVSTNPMAIRAPAKKSFIG